MPRDWVEFPELRNSEMAELYMESPHKQLVEDFWAQVVKVIDGDTLRLRIAEEDRDFDFPLRLLGIDAPEMNQEGGKEAQEWLEGLILGDDVLAMMDKNNRVGKWGRLLGRVLHRGMDLNDDIVRRGFAVPFDQRNEGELPDMNKELNIKQWL